MTLAELRTFLAEQTTHMKMHLAPSTLVDYERIWRAAGHDYVAYLRSGATTTFGKRRCAILWRLRYQFAETIAGIDENLAKGGEIASWRLLQAQGYADLITTVAAEEREGSRTQAGKSKRRDLHALKKYGDFRSRLVAAAGKAGRIAILALAIAGMRPAEIEKGVVLKVVDDNKFDVRIEGVKFTEDTGHERRVQRHDASLSELAGKLFRAIKRAGGRILLKRSADSLREDIKSAARRADISLDISPYTLRQQFAADLKASGWSRVDVAKAMGHASTRTAGRYGRKKSGSSGSSSMVEVAATGIVRDPTRKIPKARATKNNNPNNDLEP